MDCKHERATDPSGKAWTRRGEGLQPGRGRGGGGIATRGFGRTFRREREKGDMSAPQRGRLSARDYML